MREDREIRWRNWIVEAQDGKDSSYFKLLKELAPYSQRIVRSKLAGVASAEDCTQEILMAVHQARHTFDPSRKFLPWVHSIIRFKMIDQIRKRSSLSSREILDDELLSKQADPTQNHSESLDQSELSDMVRKVIQELPEKYRLVIQLAKLEEKSIKEVSAELRISESATKVRISRGYGLLRKKLEKLIQSGELVRES